MNANHKPAILGVVLDLEATCNDQPRLPPEQMEIIEIGACLVRKDGEVLDEFQTFVKPSLPEPLTPFCIELTTIRQADVDGAPGFASAIGAFEAWLTACTEKYGEIHFWGSWGDYDRKQFERNAKLVGVPAPAFLGPLMHINLKNSYAQAVGARGKGPGLGKALRMEGMRFEGVPHRGISDAKNISRLLPFCLGLKESLASKRQRDGGYEK